MKVRVLRHAQPGSSVFATIQPENSDRAEVVLAIEPPTPLATIQVPAGASLIIRSVPTSDAPAWLPGPRAEFLEYCLDVEQTFKGPLGLWPTASGAVSDVPSLRSFLLSAEQRNRPWSFLFDPISLFTPAMLEKAEDHLVRMFESLAKHPARAATLLCDAAVVGDRVIPAPLGSGLLTPMILRLARPAPSEVVLLDQDLSRQLALL